MLIKKIPIIDVNTGKVIKKYEERKNEGKIDLRQIKDINLEFKFNCRFGLWRMEGEGTGTVKILKQGKERKVAHFNSKLREGKVTISGIKKMAHNVTGLEWFQKDWNQIKIPGGAPGVLLGYQKDEEWLVEEGSFIVLIKMREGINGERFIYSKDIIFWPSLGKVVSNEKDWERV